MVKNYVRRGDWYHYNRRVPKKLMPYDRRGHIRIALNTKDEGEAQRQATIYDDFVERYWGDLVRTRRSDEDYHHFDKVRSMAKAHGFAYKNIAEIVESPIDEILARVEAMADHPKKKRQALLGHSEHGDVRLSECLERFWPLCADRLIGRSQHQLRKFKNPNQAAMKHFMKALGNVRLAQLDRSQVLRFRTFLMDRITNGEITGDTANKQIRCLKDILHTVALDAEIETDFKLLFAETRFQDQSRSRPPFDATFVQKRFLDGTSLAGLNECARMLVYIMTETGARESEIIGLTGKDIILDEVVPHIWIRENAVRTLKTKTSDRKIPLVGCALIAAQRILPNGLQRYQAKPDTASATINKYLRENDLKPTSKHTLYSLRHTFKDRLRDAGAPEEVIDELMGHKKAGPKYGRGHLLETKHHWLQKIAFKPPPVF